MNLGTETVWSFKGESLFDCFNVFCLFVCLFVLFLFAYFVCHKSSSNFIRFVRVFVLLSAGHSNLLN